MTKIIKKRMLLFWPNTANRGRIHMAIPILSAIAKMNGWEVKYHDTSFYQKGVDDATFWREKSGAFKPVDGKHLTTDVKPASQIVPDFQEIIDDFKPDIIGISGMTNDWQYLMSFFPQVKVPEDTVVAFGGTHALHSSAEILKTGLVDITCFGQVEYVLPKILKKIENNEPLDGIPGTWVIDKETGEPCRNCVSPPLSAEELWGFDPDYSMYDERYYTYPFDGKVVKMFWLETGRGCPFSCTYCEAPQLRNLYKGKGKYVISRPIENIFSTIHKLQEKFDIDVFNITNECFLSQKKSWIREFCTRWGKEVKKSFLIQTRVETADIERLDLLRLSNAPTIQIGQGIESGNKRILDLCNRKMNIDKIKASYKLMKERGFRTNAFYMMGFPTETREEVFDTIELCRSVNSDIDSISIFQPYPGLPLTCLAKDNGWITGDEIFPTFTEGSIINQPSITAEEVTKLWKVFLLYAKLPKKYWSDIKKVEDNFEENQDLYQKLIDLRWKIAERNTSAEDPLTVTKQVPLSSC